LTNTAIRNGPAVQVTTILSDRTRAPAGEY
jgi:hypothetical protein